MKKIINWNFFFHFYFTGGFFFGGRLAASFVFLIILAHATVFAQSKSLVVWINSDKGYRGLAKFAQIFEKKTGVPVVIEHPADLTQKFQLAASVGKGPDVVFWAHDRMGTWVDAGLLSPIIPSSRTLHSIFPGAWDAFTLNNNIWGVPIAIETLFLLYNKDLISLPPQSFEEIPQLDATLLKTKNAHAILWSYNEIYYSWALLGANGGYVFKHSAAGFDPKDIGLNNKGSFTGLSLIKSLVDKQILPLGIKTSDPISTFLDKKVASVITGPWTLPEMNKNHINYGVAPIPSVGGAPAAPWFGVSGGMINSWSKNKEVAQEFLEQLASQQANLSLVDQDVPLGLSANIAYYNEKQAQDPKYKTMMLSFTNGTPMPNIKEMGRFWQATDALIPSVASDKLKVKEALDLVILKMKE